jgi:hypothetical protein
MLHPASVIRDDPPAPREPERERILAAAGNAQPNRCRGDLEIRLLPLTDAVVIRKLSILRLRT